jgi:hypothetical protein
MTAAEIIAKIEDLSLDDRKAIFHFLMEALEEDAETRLFDERSREEGGRPLRQITAVPQNES